MRLLRGQKISLTVAAFAVALAVAGYAFAPLPVPVDRGLHSEIGTALAEQALSLLQPGGKITVICRDTETFPQPAMDILLKTFKHRIKGSTLSVVSVQVDPLRSAIVPPGDFFDLLRKSRSNDVIVSFLGPPILSDEMRFVLGASKARIVALCAGPMTASLDLHALFDAGLLNAAVVSQSFAKPNAGAIRRAPHGFAVLYRTYQSNEIARLPKVAAAPEFRSD